MKVTAVFMNRSAVEFSLQTDFRFDPQYRRVTVELTDEQSKKLSPKKGELLSIVFLEGESEEE